jgi:hemerythrin-like metal-binding protein
MDRHDDALVLGVEAIDREHIAVLDLLAKFIACVKAKADAEEALDVLSEAIKAGNAHMEHEEHMMDEAGYPGVEEHKRLHRTARLTYTTLMSDTFAFRAHDPALLEQFAAVERLLCHHFSGPDRQFAEYLITRGIH